MTGELQKSIHNIYQQFAAPQVHRDTHSHTHTYIQTVHCCAATGRAPTWSAIESAVMGHAPFCGQGQAPHTHPDRQEACSLTGAQHALQEEDDLREAWRYSADGLGGLRTSSLTPQKYFELYMQVFDELRHLEVGTRGVCSWNWQVSPMTKPAYLDASLTQASMTWLTPACR